MFINIEWNGEWDTFLVNFEDINTEGEVVYSIRAQEHYDGNHSAILC